MTGLKKVLVSLAIAGMLITPLVGSAAAISTGVGGSFPAAGLELLSDTQGKGQMNEPKTGTANSSLINFLLKNKTSSQKYLLVVSNSNSATDIIINTGESVMAIGGFLGNDKSITLDEFKELAKKGEVRYVMTGGNRGDVNGGENAAAEIMNWVQQNGTAVSSSEYSNINESDSQVEISDNSSDLNNEPRMSGVNHDGFGGNGAGQLYDLKLYTDSLTK